MSLLWVRTAWLPWLTYIVLDTLAIGLGMGVPILAIALGLPAGWTLAGRVAPAFPVPARAMRRVLSYLALASLFTFCVLAAVWIPGGVAYLKAGRDPAEFGIPLILYSPRASFVGWLVLMVVISPALQFLVAWLGAGLSLVRLWR